MELYYESGQASGIVLVNTLVFFVENNFAKTLAFSNSITQNKR